MELQRFFPQLNADVLEIIFEKIETTENVVRRCDLCSQVVLIDVPIFFVKKGHPINWAIFGDTLYDQKTMQYRTPIKTSNIKIEKTETLEKNPHITKETPQFLQVQSVFYENKVMQLQEVKKFFIFENKCWCDSCYLLRNRRRFCFLKWRNDKC